MSYKTTGERGSDPLRVFKRMNQKIVAISGFRIYGFGENIYLLQCLKETFIKVDFGC